MTTKQKNMMTRLEYWSLQDKLTFRSQLLTIYSPVVCRRVMHAINAYLQNPHYTLSTTQMFSLTSNQDFNLVCITSDKVGCVALINACVRLVERGKRKTCVFMNQAIVLVPADNRLRIAARRTLKSERNHP